MPSSTRPPAPMRAAPVPPELTKAAPNGGRKTAKISPDVVTESSSAPCTRSFRVSSSKSWTVLWRLITQPIGVSVVAPKDYFKASNELTVLALIVCWSLTLAVNWRLAWDHPARRFVGHMNPCFGWDYPPASYFAVCFAGADVYFAFRYASLEALRTRLLDLDGRRSWAERFAEVTAYLHALASVLWLLLWSVGPPDGEWTAHLAIFSVCVLFRYLCTLGNYVESRCGDARQKQRVERKHTVFIWVYGAVTCTLPVLYFSDVIVYRAQHRVGVDPPIPWPVLQVMDLVWVGCLASSTRLAVPEPPIQISCKILEFDEEYSCHEKEAMLGLQSSRGRVLAGVKLSAMHSRHGNASESEMGTGIED